MNEPWLNWTVLLAVFALCGLGALTFKTHGHPVAVVRVMVRQRLGLPVGKHRRKLTKRF